ncbi:MAG: hypothetical protein KDC08_02310 [Actinobacteria bacterium]|nr:hypothetical protein [Actinomycetota bacterium]
MRAPNRYESTRATLRRSLAGGGRVTWVHEPGSPVAVTCWPFSQVLHAYALSDSVSGPARFPGLVRGLAAYRDPRGAYRESIGRGKRYYDDNAWLGLAFLQRHAFSSGQASRQRALDIDGFVQSGLDPATGGIRWVEDGETLNACSTGAGALLHTMLGGDIRASLDFLAELRNSDGLVQDHVRADGSIDAGVFSSNQGLLIAAAYRAGNAVLAREASDAGAEYFTAERLWKQPVSFNAVYAKAQMVVGRAHAVREYAVMLDAEGRDHGGWFTLAGRYDDGSVLDTAGALQLFLLLEFPHLMDRAV